jgi:hypothetical protein
MKKLIELYFGVGKVGKVGRVGKVSKVGRVDRVDRPRNSIREKNVHLGISSKSAIDILACEPEFVGFFDKFIDSCCFNGF